MVGHALAWLPSFACASAPAKVPEGPHVPALMAPEPVAFAPPPATLEVIEPSAQASGSGCAWLDGEWRWNGRDWRWAPGSWVVTPKNCYHAAPVLVWVPAGGDGALYHVPGRWYEREAPKTCPDPAPCSSRLLSGS